MEFGTVTRILSNKLNETVVVYNSVRKPGFVYKYSYFRPGKRGNEYRCCHCRELGKQRVITVVDDKVVGRKHPEDDHHENCVPTDASAVTALHADREMRNEVGTTYIVAYVTLNNYKHVSK